MKATKTSGSHQKKSYSSPALPGAPLTSDDIAGLIHEGEKGEAITMEAFQKKWQPRLDPIALPVYPFATGEITTLVREGEETRGATMDAFKKKWRVRPGPTR